MPETTDASSSPSGGSILRYFSRVPRSTEKRPSKRNCSTNDSEKDIEIIPNPKKLRIASKDPSTVLKEAKLCADVLLGKFDPENMEQDENDPNPVELTKTTAMQITHAFADHERKRLVENLNQNPFSLMVRSYPEVNGSCTLALVVRHAPEKPEEKSDENSSPAKEKVKLFDDMLALVNVTDKTPKRVADGIDEVLSKMGVPWVKCMAVASDDRQLLKECNSRHKNLLLVDFMSHSMEASFLGALKRLSHVGSEQNKPWMEIVSNLEEFVSDIVTYPHATNSDFDILHVPASKSIPGRMPSPNAPLLSTLQVMKLLVENWDTWKSFFEAEAQQHSAEERPEAHWLLERFQPENPTKAVLDFLKWQLEKIREVDDLFVSDRPMVFGIVGELLRFFINRVIKSFLAEDSSFFRGKDGNVLHVEELDFEWLFDESGIDVINNRTVTEKINDCLLPDEKVYLGYPGEQAARTLNEQNVLLVKQAAKQFYIELAFETARRLDFRPNSILESLEVLNPWKQGPEYRGLRSKACERLAGLFPKVKLPKSDYYSQPGTQLEAEVSALPHVQFDNHLHGELKCEDWKDKEFPVKFWKAVRELRDYVWEDYNNTRELQQYPSLTVVSRVAMVFPHATTSVEALFKKVNRPTDPSTTPLVLALVEDRLLAKQFIERSCIGSKFKMPEDLLSSLWSGDHEEKFEKLCEANKQVFDGEMANQLEKDIVAAGWDDLFV